MENNIRQKGDITKKIVKILLKIIYQLLIIMCLILTIIIVLQKVTNSNKTIFGYRIFRVITGSMEPQYDIGQVVICKEVEPQNIKIGDDIVYLGTFGEYNGKIIMHEVTGIDRDENNDLNFHAKGLHSASVEDPQIKASQIYGVVKFKSGILTVLYKLATSIYSAFIIITILVLNVFISFKASGKNKVHELEEHYEEVDKEDVEDEEDVEEDIEEDIEEDVEQENEYDDDDDGDSNIEQ